jgi:hypothetical protein
MMPHKPTPAEAKAETHLIRARRQMAVLSIILAALTVATLAVVKLMGQP